jgi:hypothetical protein
MYTACPTSRVGIGIRLVVECRRAVEITDKPCKVASRFDSANASKKAKQFPTPGFPIPRKFTYDVLANEKETQS